MFLQLLQVVTEGQKPQVLESCHASELGGGHFGRDKTLAKISERFYWLGMVEDIKEFCKSCDKCQRANRLETVCIGSSFAYKLNGHFSVKRTGQQQMSTSQPESWQKLTKR